MKLFIPLLILMSLLITEAVAQSPPGPPTNVTATPGDRQVTLSWTPPSNKGTGLDIIFYQYKRDSDTHWRFTSNLSVVYRTGTQAWINGTTYTLRVRAVGNDGSTDYPSSHVSLKATPMMPAPTNFRATAGDGQVTLNWTTIPRLPDFHTNRDVTDYDYSQNGGAWTPIGSTSTSHLVTGLENGRSYTFRVRGRRGSEVPGRPSRTVTVTPLRDAPGTPGTLNVQRDEDTAILTWSPPSDTEEETPIRYEYSDDGGSTWTSTGSTDTTYTVTGLERGETYTFLVRAVYIDGGTSRIISPRSRSSNSAVLTFPNRVIYECPVGWQRTDRFGGPTQRVLLYEIKLQMDLHNRISIYQPIRVAIYVHPDEGLENLDGWKLKVAVPYNLHREYLLTAENSVVVDANIEGVEGGFAFIENPEEDPFPMVGMGFTGALVPGFDYRLYDDTGRKVDFGIACYKQGGIFQVLKEMEDPRVLRNVLLETLDWDAATYIRSEWTVPTPAPAAPSQVKGNIVGTWANLKKQ